MLYANKILNNNTSTFVFIADWSTVQIYVNPTNILINVAIHESLL